MCDEMVTAWPHDLCGIKVTFRQHYDGRLRKLVEQYLLLDACVSFQRHGTESMEEESTAKKGNWLSYF